MLGIVWRVSQEVPVLLGIIGLLYLIGPQIEQDTMYGVTLIVIALALTTILGFIKGFSEALKNRDRR